MATPHGVFHDRVYDTGDVPVRVRSSRRSGLQKVRNSRTGVREQRKAIRGTVRKVEVTTKEVTDLGAGGILRGRCIKVDHGNDEGTGAGVENAAIGLNTEDGWNRRSWIFSRKMKSKSHAKDDNIWTRMYHYEEAGCRL